MLPAKAGSDKEEGDPPPKGTVAIGNDGMSASQHSRDDSEQKPAAKRSRTERGTMPKHGSSAAQERQPALHNKSTSRVPSAHSGDDKQDDLLPHNDVGMIRNQATGRNLSQVAGVDQGRRVGSRVTDESVVAAFASQVQNALDAERERASRLDLLSRILRPQHHADLSAVPSPYAQVPSDVQLLMRGLGAQMPQQLQLLPRASYSILSLPSQQRHNLQSILAQQTDAMVSLPMLGLPLLGSNPYLALQSRDTIPPSFPLSLSSRLQDTVVQAGPHSAMRSLPQPAFEPHASSLHQPALPTLDRRTTPSSELEVSQQSSACKFHARTVPVSAASDRDSVSKLQALLRDQLLYFEAVLLDVQASAQGRNKPIRLGQVGLMCRHCRNVLPRHRPRGAVYFPQKLSGIYQSAQNMLNNHFSSGGGCPNAPSTLHEGLRAKRGDKTIVYGGGQQYWARTASRAGVVEKEDGLAFASSENESAAAAVP